MSKKKKIKSENLDLDLDESDDFGDLDESGDDNIAKKVKKKIEKKTSNIEKPTNWVFKGNLRRNGVMYSKGSVCPTNKVVEMEELGFIESV